MAFFKSAETYYAEMTSTLSDVDVSNHSLIYNSLMPTCYELSYQSLMLDEATKRVFAKSALENGYGSDLLKRCEEMGIDRKLATIATGTAKVTGVAGHTFPKNAIVSTILGITYTTNADVTLDSTGTGYVNITATGSGSNYNTEADSIAVIPVKYTGISSITNESKIDNGYDYETYEALYERYSLKVRTPSTSGNKYHYKNWALEVNGCGSATVIPLWNGNGTVKVIIANSNKRAASADLIQAVYNHIEEERPIGPTITVVSVEELLLNVNVIPIYDLTTYTVDAIKTNIKNAIENYLKEVALKIKYISIAKIGALILSAPGVTDYSNLTINGVTQNINIADNNIVVIGEVACNAA